MNKEKFLEEARKQLRAKFLTNKEAAEEMQISAPHLSNILKGNIENIPQSFLDVVGFIKVEAQYKKVKK